MTIGRHEIGVHSLVGNHQEERPLVFTFLEPIQRILGQLIRDVPLLRHSLAVDVESVVAVLGHLTARATTIGPIRALPFETYPMIKPRLPVINVAAHVPFPDIRRVISVGLKILREVNQPFRQWIVVIHHPVVVRVFTGENAGATGRT